MWITCIVIVWEVYCNSCFSLNINILQHCRNIALFVLYRTWTNHLNVLHWIYSPTMIQTSKTSGLVNVSFSLIHIINILYLLNLAVSFNDSSNWILSDFVLHALSNILVHQPFMSVTCKWKAMRGFPQPSCVRNFTQWLIHKVFYNEVFELLNYIFLSMQVSAVHNSDTQ